MLDKHGKVVYPSVGDMVRFRPRSLKPKIFYGIVVKVYDGLAYDQRFDVSWFTTTNYGSTSCGVAMQNEDMWDFYKAPKTHNKGK